jgi:hypothetical protein
LAQGLLKTAVEHAGRGDMIKELFLKFSPAFAANLKWPRRALAINMEVS